MSLIYQMYQLARNETGSRLAAVILAPLLATVVWLLLGDLRSMEAQLEEMGPAYSSSGRTP